MTVDTCYKIVNFIVNNVQNGSLSPDEFNTVINQAQTDFLSFLLGEFQQYQAGHPQPRVSYSQNEIARGRLTPLIYGPATLNIPGTGLAPYPSDYQQVDAITANVYGLGLKRVRYCSQDRFYAFYNSRIDPYANDPFYLVEKTGLRFYPNNLAQATWYYVQTPPQIKWNYTPDVNGLPVYSVSGSVDPVWYDVDMMEIISRALRSIGINLQSPLVKQYADQIIGQGQ